MVKIENFEISILSPSPLTGNQNWKQKGDISYLDAYDTFLKEENWDTFFWLETNIGSQKEMLIILSWNFFWLETKIESNKEISEKIF